MWREVNTPPESRRSSWKCRAARSRPRTVTSPHFIGGFPVGMQRPVRENSSQRWRREARPLPTHCSRRRFFQRTTGPPWNLTFAHAAEKASYGDSSHSRMPTDDRHTFGAERLHPTTMNWRCRPKPAGGRSVKQSFDCTGCALKNPDRWEHKRRDSPQLTGTVACFEPAFGFAGSTRVPQRIAGTGAARHVNGRRSEHAPTEAAFAMLRLRRRPMPNQSRPKGAFIATRC